MKKFICSTVLFFSLMMAFSQDKTNTQMFGLNATSFIDNFLSFNENSTSTTTPFQFTYRVIKPNNKAFRSQLGILMSTTVTTTSNDDDKSTLNFYTINIAAGYEKRNQFSERWLVYGGIDALAGVKNSTFINTNGGSENESRDTQEEMNIGIAPVIGIQFNLTPRISISTEAALALKYIKAVNSSSFGDETAQTSIISIQMSPSLPTFVYLNLSF